MFEKIIQGSVKNGLMVMLLVAGIIGAGIWSLSRLTIDAVPDITNNQVQVVTVSPSLAPQEVEQFITYPVEIAMANLPKVQEIRSVSRYGLSVVTVVFEEDLATLDARQYVKEQIDVAIEDIPDGMGVPGLMPITTGLGEVYQYTLEVDDESRRDYDAQELRTLQDWIVKRQLAGIPGVVEISSFGGFLKQYEVSVNPRNLNALGITLHNVWEALSANNLNAGGSYIEKDKEAWYIRAEGLIRNVKDIESISVTAQDGTPIRLGSFAKIIEGHAPRFGAMTMDGEGEAVGGIVLMLKGENAYAVTKRIEARVEEIQSTLPDGVHIRPYLDRADLVSRTINTVTTNLVEGGLIVIFVLILLLGNWRAGLIVASVIPLSMLFAITCMNLFGVSANLMSLGAIDFGIVVDGAVIIVESVLFHLHSKGALNRSQHRELVIESSGRIYKSAAFGVLIILVVFIPVLTLQGVEGRMFRPMAQTVSFAMLGALILSLTYVPWISSFALYGAKHNASSFSERLVKRLQSIYRNALNKALAIPKLVVGLSTALLIGAFALFTQMGSVFIPTLEEGDLAMQVSMRTGTNLTEMIRTCTKAERVLIEEFPEVKHVVSKIGTAEVPTDPMPIEAADVMILLHPKEEWTSASTREELVSKMEEALEHIRGASFEFTQPIQLRFNELLSGSKADVAVKIYGEDLDTLAAYAERASRKIQEVEGAADVKVEATLGMRFQRIVPDRQLLAFHGVDMQEVGELIEFAYAGGVAGTVYEGERRFDLVVRLTEEARLSSNLNHVFVTSAHGHRIPLSALVNVENVEGPSMISRDNTMRRIAIGVNVRERDIASVVADVSAIFDSEIDLPPGYRVEYGGDFENLENATARLQIAVPVALVLILILLFATFGSAKYAFLIFSAVPLSAIGGVAALYLRGMPFSISAGIGFIALFGVAVLNGIVMVSHLNDLKDEGKLTLHDILLKGGTDRLRPVIMTASVAALGFLPMALSTSAGAEVQKPLATVVIGGLISATLLTLIVLPVLYQWIHRKNKLTMGKTGMIVIGIMLSTGINAQQTLSAQDAVAMGVENHPRWTQAEGAVRQARAEKSAAVDLAPTEFGLQYGQINATDFDYNLSVQQDIGSILSHLRRGQSGAALIELREAEFHLEERKLAWLIRQAYYDWAMSYHKWMTLKNQYEMLSGFNDKVALRAELGETLPSEAIQSRAELRRFANRIVEAHAEYLNYERALSTLLQTETEYIPEGDDYTPLLMTQQVRVLDTALLEPLVARQMLTDANVKTESSVYFPTFSVGYFNQMLEGIPGFQGVSVGMSYPLWFARQRADVRSAKIEAEIAQRQAVYQTQEYKQALDQVKRTLDLRMQQLGDFAEPSRQDAEALMEAAEAEWENGEIDFYAFFQLMRTAVNLELDRLQTIHDYNSTVLHYEFLTQ
ncbi:CusA/CzcA family heavy metal efflux RND transporter [Phaeocystidibacter luteus]|uniref:CusA/CzcA family heavy metal efflux RND transporter n=1 Tax=Phaeocystidibacter luteus TaxID=911197 RepID=A0A6N6RDV7_9FLAO|nr:CusA/CzcA family heavy metal efflux RND transporter [Phaeocystidibacter luteus]KAB2805347.1 CusA/CzcA family heavy metal efflux RND transporter [Phaeocystidibacter luteus]